jgi:hypothetical protein
MHYGSKSPKAAGSGFCAEPEDQARIRQGWNHGLGLAYLSAFVGSILADMGEHQLTIRDHLRHSNQRHQPVLAGDTEDQASRAREDEAWFANISQVPKQAISMSVRQILTAREILAVVPDSPAKHKP